MTPDSTRLVDRHGHTERDHAALVAAGVDPASTQPREQPVRCYACPTRTWHQAGNCDRHYMVPAAVERQLKVAS